MPPSDSDTAPKPKLRTNPTALGIALILLSTVGLGAQNVILRLFFAPSLLWGQVRFGGFVTPQFSNLVLLLGLRMAIMALLLAGVATRLYPDTWQVLRSLPSQPKLLNDTLGSGICLFGGSVLLYGALSQVATGIAIATFFVYPAVTVLLAWYFFRQRPPAYQLWLMGVIFCGVLLTTLTPVAEASSNPLLGALSALGAALGFGFYGIFAEPALQAAPGQKALHPVPFSLLTFALIAGLSGLTVAVAHPLGFAVAIAPARLSTLLVMTLLSALLTLIAYLLNNFGIRYVGASLTALIGTSTPALTTLFAWWILQEVLQPQQLLGMVLVIIGVAALSLKAR